MRRRPRRKGRKRTPTELLARRRLAELRARRLPKVRAGTGLVYKDPLRGGVPVRAVVLRQTASGRITIRLPDGSKRSILPPAKPR